MPSVKARPPCPAHLLLLLLAASIATSQDDGAIPPTWLDCGAPPPSPSPSPPQPPTPTTTTTTNGTMFRTNLLALLDALPRAAASTGFASLSLGAGRDRAFVRGVCRGDSAPTECLANMQVAARNLSGSCASSRRAAVWYDKCYVTYADTNTSTAHEEGFVSVVYDSRTVADPGSFERTYEALMGRLVARAASTGGGNGSAWMFATGEAGYARDDPNGTMYGLVQCMRDRGAAYCRRCLQNSVDRFPACCQGHQGGVVLRYDCYLPIQIYPYYDLALDAPPPAAQPPPPVPSSSPAGERRGNRRPKHAILAVTLPTTLLFLVFVLVCIYLQQRRRIKANKRPRVTDNSTTEEGSTYVNRERFTLALLRAATGNFAAENKLGEGGFGQVFKGILQDGQTIAVKRLSKSSTQGFHELKNELTLAAKLRHRNVVQLLGVCLKEQEKLVVYEYLPNRSLDTVLFDHGSRRRHGLDWRKRYMIICGIARGLLYLHEESRLRVIHRDLKPSNVLLDERMNPKISDFGLARAFWRDQSRDVTKRPAGTLGYMSPEYAYCGHVSTKSDMFSFGVIVLEIVTGRRNNSPCDEEDANTRNLLSYVWEKWRAGSAAEIADASLGDQYPQAEMLSCVQVGLLCVQKKPALRPDASAVVLMLDGRSSTSLQTPSRPAFHSGSTGVASGVGIGNAVLHGRRRFTGNDRLPSAPVSENAVTMSELEPR